MDSAQKNLVQVVTQRLKQLETNAFAVEKAAGLPADAVRSILRGEKKSGTTLNRAKDVCEALGLELYIGLPRDIAGAPQPPAADPNEFANIPLHEASLAAGAGVENGSEPVVDYLSFRRDWLRRIGTAPADAVLARVEGESMQPTIWAGDMVLIDTGKTEIPIRTSNAKKGRSSVYALLDDGRARVKRIERPTQDQVMLLSDNPDNGPEFADTKTLTIIGKVMWWGHTNRD
jgi:phage repressor protein C with HTH and peptisase S24 domain